ncbi:hypothetical protein GVN16_21840 [Emticicia sp. CRIBPO]|uniref:hypothetical protein n=1 Tax=Emticicia sp. CRIBPO TaxID=2683258 RepID=UPI0014130F17|nr:hypothetical protein [Emticicia sp. CRIBPO]NBA88431.1 hypothetical protein [Emticicia sp. CRIBPO]
MKLRLLFYGFVVALAFGCLSCGEERRAEEETEEEEMEKYKFPLVTIPPYYPATPFIFPVFIHDNYETAGSKKIIPAHSPWISLSDYELLYIGMKADTLYTDKYAYQKNSFSYDSVENGKEWYSLPTPLSISLKIDTSTIIPYESIRKDTLIKRYPVYIINTLFHPVIIGSNSDIPLILEAKTPNQEWKPIQIYYGMMCGIGAKGRLLFPGEIAVTAVKVFRGPFNTKMRLRFRSHFYDIFSNEFEGSIEVNQFGDPY